MKNEPREDFPWWLILLVGIGAWMFYEVWANQIYSDVLSTLAKGIWITVAVTLIAYGSACVIGLALALAGLSRFQILRQASRFYVEVMRGIPIIVLLLYVAFAAAPALVVAVNWVLDLVGAEPWRTRDFPLIARAVIALTLAYSAFLAEVFRAGLLAVEKGQIEAAMALGLSGWQRFRLVVFPQAFRTILPPLGNDFVAMVKDSLAGVGAGGDGHHAAGQGDGGGQFSLF